MAKPKIYGVLLTDEAYTQIGTALAPYVSEGPIGKYIYCNHVEQNGSFFDMTFAPHTYKGSHKGEMLISIPVRFVTFIASGDDSLPLGFALSK